jgi:hypothetical protein
MTIGNAYEETMKKLIPYFCAWLAVLALPIFACGRLHAQCRQVDTGINGEPIYRCDNNNGGWPSTVYYGAFAVDSHNKLSGAWGYSSANDAVNSAVKICMQGGGERCEWIRINSGGAFTMMAAVSSDAVGVTWVGLSGKGKDAEKSAMKYCSENSKRGGCRLLCGAIGAGPNYSSERNQQNFSLSDQQRLALSTERSEKKYLSTVATEVSTPIEVADPALQGSWGAFAASRDRSNAVYNLPSKEDAEQKALSACKGCTVISTFENTCAGWAWPNDRTKTALQFNVIALDDDPDVAGKKAYSQCTQQYGGCSAQVRCAGRHDKQFNPYANGTPPSGTN